MAGQATFPASVSAGASDFLLAVQTSVGEVFARAPALVLGLGLLAAVPPLAVAGWLLKRSLARKGHAAVEGADATQLMPTDARRASREKAEPILTEGGPAWPSDAWVHVEGGARYGIGRGVVRIGREADNDICLSDMTVHRYHAAIHRSDDAEYIVTDLSSADGNGVAINGNRMPNARLRDGDTIELGNVRMTFIARPT